MKRTTLLTAALAIAFVIAFANPALANRDPGMGMYGPGVPMPPRIGQTGLNGQYADGMNLYQYVGSNPVIYVDPLGLWKWKDGKRGGNARAIILSETGDSTATAAKFARLEPSESGKWLKNEKTGKWVSPGEAIDTPDCPYSIPNTVYVTKGDVSALLGPKGGITFVNMWTSMTISGYIKEMKQRGYRVVYDSRATAADISGYLGQEDAYGWFFGGHGAAGILFCAKAGGPDYEDIMTTSIASGALHHKLGFVTLYACQAGEVQPGEPVSDWVNLVSRYGILRAKVGNVHPAWTDWDEIPIVPHLDEK